MCRKYLKYYLIVEFRHDSLASLQSTRVGGRTRTLLGEKKTYLQVLHYRCTGLQVLHYGCGSVQMCRC